MSESDRVIIVGGGPVGLFSAIRLTGFGIPVTLIEKALIVSDDIRASTIHPPTLEMLAPYGVTTEILENGIRVPQWQIRDHATGEKAVFDLGLIAEETDYPFRVQFEQAKICEIIDAKLRNEPLADLRYGMEMLSADQDDDGVRVRAKGEDAEEVLRGRYLIAADGGNSTIREQLGLAFEGSMYPERSVLVTTPFAFDEHIEGLSPVSYCWEANGNFSLLQLPGRWRASLYFPGELTPEEALADDRIERQLQDICPSAMPYEISDKRVYRVHQRIVPRYDHGRIVLAGDAAHLNSPSGGMGMNGGLHDAHNLTEKINEAWQGGDHLALFALYSRQRKKIAEEQIIKQADQNRKRMTEKDPAKRRKSLAEMQGIADDPARCKAFLMRSSMIEGLRQAAAIT